MSGRRQEQLEQLFNAALERESETERAAFLDEACGDDLELRSSLEALFNADRQTDTFLDSPVLDLRASSDTSALDLKPGTTVGAYTLVEPIGEGGFGSVYLAEQTEPVPRQVALKIIKPGMDTKEVLARFDGERQALALMDHPGIARVLDAGVTKDRRPYFVMELVKGKTITEHCDRNRLTINERLQLFLQVCDALQHAHQKGIIHRDIKPNNVLVALRNGRSIPKLIDFGIAKATNRRLTEKTLLTELRQFLGTPEYMSPDQLDAGKADVDTRADVYSLGVMLYELLVGTTPFDAETLRHADCDEIRRIIRDVEPEMPSSRVAALASGGAEVAAHRQIEPAALARMIRGDLDWIVMKALEKDRARRYQSAGEFAADLERHLRLEPVLAGPPGTLYRLSKFVRRNRVAVFTGSLISAAVLVGLVLASLGYIQATRARTALEIERDAAERARAGERIQRERAEAHAVATEKEAAKYAAVHDFLEEMLVSVDPRRAQGREVAMREALDLAAAKIAEGSLAGQPEVEAAVRTTIGKTYEALGLYPTAEEHLRVAESLYRRTLDREHPESLRSRSMLAGVLRRQRRFAEAEAMFREVVEAQQRIQGPEHIDTLVSMNGLGIALWRQGKSVEAERIHRSTLEIQRRVLGDEHLDTLRSRVNLATTLWRQGRHDEAEKSLRPALAGGRRTVGEEHPFTIGAINNLAVVLERQGKLAEAETLYRRSLELDKNVRGIDHPDTWIPLNNLLSVLRQQGKWEEARACVVEQIAIRKRAAEQSGADAGALNSYAWLLMTCAPADLQDPKTALSVAQRAFELDGARDAYIADTLALAYKLNGDLDRAIEMQRKAVHAARADSSRDPAALEAKLARYLLEKGDIPGAGQMTGHLLLRRLGELMESASPAQSPGGLDQATPPSSTDADNPDPHRAP